ncbi:hypothetical protein [Chryseobacterium scophthalmum]|uniref:hypothetical protein n=1 Tax=Chryseobacterium scophthalmum TaxID=59733 RepID=UPI003CFF6259
MAGLEEANKILTDNFSDKDLVSAKLSSKDPLNNSFSGGYESKWPETIDENKKYKHHIWYFPNEKPEKSE